MFKFICKQGHVNERCQNRLSSLNFHQIYADSSCTFYINSIENKKQYHTSNDIHLLMEGIVTNLKTPDRTETEDCDQNQLKQVLDIYLDQGERALERLDGSFTIVIWDSPNQKIHVCRDDGGAKLLYYFTDNSGSYFSNSLELLVRVHEKPSISLDALDEYLRFLDISAPYTIFEKIFFLDPEKIITAGASIFELSDKNKGPVRIPDISVNDFDKNLTSFKNLFFDCINSYIPPKKEIGVFLSGGIDSSLVCAVSADIKKDITAFTVGFHDSRFDESPVAQKVASHLGIRHEVLRFTLDQDMEAFTKYTSTVPSPFADPAIIPTFQCFKHIGSQMDLMLDGTGADTLSGIMPARHIRFILNYSRHLPENLRILISNLFTCNKWISNKKDLFQFSDAAELLIRWKGWSREEISALRKSDATLEHTMFYQIYRNNMDKSPFELYSMLMGALPDDRIHFSSFCFGPDVLFPFFNREIRSFVKHLPLKHRYSSERPKRLFDCLLNEYVPRRIWDVPKHGFDYPFDALLKHKNNLLINEYLSREALDWHGLFDGQVVKDYISRFSSGDFSLKFKIWALVVFQAWYKNFFWRIT